MAVLAVFFLTTTLTLSAGQMPPKCCLPERFQASVTHLSTINGKTMEISDFALDFTEQKQVLVTNIFDPVSHMSNRTAKVVWDFAKMKQFFIPNDDPSKCIEDKINFRVRRCIPDDAQYLGSSYLGALSALPYDGWRFTLDGSDIVVTITLSTQGCVPIVEGVSAPGQPESDELLLFTNFEPTIHNPDWFNVPPNCNSRPRTL